MSHIGAEAEKSIGCINSYPDISVDKYAVMPNHVHMIISIYNEEFGKAGIDIPEIVKRFKSYTTKIFGGEL